MTVLATALLTIPAAHAGEPRATVMTSSASQRALPDRLLERIVDQRHRTWACEQTLALRRTRASSSTIGSPAYARWVLRLWTERANTICKVARHLTDTGVLRQIVDPCLAGIIARENASWDPTVDFGWGHGNVHEAYGIPQANPGTKMASAGEDWRTNPITQLRWMASYARDWYGSSCAALHHRNTAGWY